MRKWLGHRRRSVRAKRLRTALGSQEGFGLTEMLVASTVGGIGFLAVASMQLAAVTQARIAETRTNQALAAQQVFEEMHRQGYAAAVSGNRTTTVDGYTYNVAVTVTNTAIRVKRVSATVPTRGTLTSQNFITRMYEPRPVPTVP